jgi:Mn-dependent DtxR family transcriptional regulator
MVIKEAVEMYLETILVLSKELEHVRSLDVAVRMGYSKPTISEQMKTLKENGLVRMDENNYIYLTPRGTEIADRTYERHVMITKMFKNIGVSPVTAEQDACRIEHYISEETFDCMKAFFAKEEGLDLNGSQH